MTITYPITDKLYVNVTNRCSNDCDFCIRNNSDSVDGSGSLWLEREPSVEEIVEDIKKRDLPHFSELVFCGYGEPTDRLGDILAVVRELKSVSNIRVRIDTNGQADLIAGRPTARELEGLIDVVSVSLNTPDAASYDRLCHSDFGPAAFDALIAYAVECKKYVPQVFFTVVDVIGPEDIEKCRKIAAQAGVPLRVRKKID